MKIKPLPFRSLSPKQIARYWRKVAKAGPDECWPWTASLCGIGRKKRGQMTVSGYHGHALRVGWFIAHGFDPYPLHVLHTCDNGRCHNPAHWFRGTNRDNCQDKAKKFRNGRKLSPDKVRQIRSLRAKGMSQQAIADQIGVHQTLIGFICRGAIWAHVN